MIFQGMEQGIYECYGMFDRETIVGYSYLIRLDTDYLIDYLATDPICRNKGYGGILIELLRAKLTDATSIIGEVEDPSCAKCEEDRLLQDRRYHFYLRNGFRDTNVRAVCFGVPFRIIETGKGLVHDEEVIKVLYKRHYQSILPKQMYEKHVQVV